MISIFLQGFFLQANLILALGAQNIFVLNSGLRKQRHLLEAFVSSSGITERLLEKVYKA